MKLHPTMKKCSCGFIGNRSQLYHHFAAVRKAFDTLAGFYSEHGEVPLNEDEGEEFLNVNQQLVRSMSNAIRLL